MATQPTEVLAPAGASHDLTPGLRQLFCAEHAGRDGVPRQEDFGEGYGGGQRMSLSTLQKWLSGANRSPWSCIDDGYEQMIYGRQLPARVLQARLGDIVRLESMRMRRLGQRLKPIDIIGMQIVQEITAELAQATADALSEVLRSLSPHSEGGREITPGEADSIDSKVDRAFLLLADLQLRVQQIRSGEIRSSEAA